MDANLILEQCLLEEEKYQFPSFWRDDVWDLGCCLVEAARATGKPLAAEIVVNGTLVFRYYPEGTGKANERWLGYKRNTVEDTQKSSLRVFAEFEVAGKTLQDELMDPAKYAAGTRDRNFCPRGYVHVLFGPVRVVQLSGRAGC